MVPNIIYEDNHILIVEKPINIPVQEDLTGDLDLLNILKQYIKEKYNKPGNVYLGLVHRLDRPVGGIMIFAKTSKAASRLSEQIRTNKLHKEYLAILTGTPTKQTYTLENYLYKDEKTNIVYVVESNKKDAKKAILDYTVLKSIDKYCLVKIILHTGRSHQIRVQFANIGHPLYGDQKYGKNSIPGKQIALWSYKIGFYHPIKNEYVEYICEPNKNIIPWNLLIG